MSDIQAGTYVYISLIWKKKPHRITVNVQDWRYSYYVIDYHGLIYNVAK